MDSFFVQDAPQDYILSSTSQTIPTPPMPYACYDTFLPVNDADLPDLCRMGSIVIPSDDSSDIDTAHSLSHPPTPPSDDMDDPMHLHQQSLQQQPQHQSMTAMLYNQAPPSFMDYMLHAMPQQHVYPQHPHQQDAASTLISPPPQIITPNDTMMLTKDLFASPYKKVAHNAIERRYRNNINDRIKELQRAVPALNRAALLMDQQDEQPSNKKRTKKQQEQDDAMDDEFDDDNAVEMPEEDGVTLPKKLNKASILQKATEYIHHLKSTQHHLEQENALLQCMLKTLPGGDAILDRFLSKKIQFEQDEKERRRVERKQAQIQEKLDHQRLLKERAVQRAALMTPEERQRRRYQRRHLRQQSVASSVSSMSPESSPNASKRQKSKSKSPSVSPLPTQPLMVPQESQSIRLFSILAGLSFFALPDPSSSTMTHHRVSKLVFDADNAAATMSTPMSTWQIARWVLASLAILCLVVLPILSKCQIRSSQVKKRLSHS
ncbi:helix-loop-helix DNA-binding domain-containing protein [Gongronella butleri]|nr:helix-loop-helix DNA-binding domain-containing protein [Gongronella butleri]